MQHRDEVTEVGARIWDWWVPRVWLAQALYYVSTGIWPLVSIRSFQFFTGRKTDLWLVKAVGVLVIAIGSAIGLAGKRGRITPEITVLATGSAIGLASIDITYTLRRRISPIYLGDAAVNILLAITWMFRMRR